MSLLDLINAIEAGDSQNIEKHFDYEMTSRLAERLDAKRIEVAKNMFNEDVEELDEKISPLAAKEILQHHDAHGKDFFELSHSQVSGLVDSAKKHGYRKNKNAPGSTGRMFHQHLHRLAGKLKEDVEIIDEISKDTLKSYVDKSSKEGVKAHGEGDLDKAKKRYKGVHTALNKLTKEDFDDITPEDIEEFMRTEEFDQLDEISKDTLKSYMDKSIQSYSDTGTKLRSKLQQGEEDPKLRKKIRNRLQGQMKAYDKLKKA